MIDPATLALIIAGIRAAITAAPQIKDIVVKAKDFITTLFAHGLISKETQDNIHAHVDEVCAAALAGTTLPEWQVEADPT